MNAVLSSAARWQDIVAKARAVFDLSKRLPQRVHRLRCGATPLFDGDIIFGSRGWSMVSSLAEYHGDPAVHFLTVEPAEQHFLKTTGKYGAFTTSVASDADAYAEALFGAGEIAYVAGVAALFGDSGRWGIWSERHLAGLVTTEDPTSLVEWEIQNGPFVSAEDALEDFLRVNIGAGPRTEPFASELRRNYGVFGADR